VIREFQLSTADAGEAEIHEPPSGILRVSVIGDDAHLDWHQQPRPDTTGTDTPLTACSFRVSTRSLLLALRAAWEDDHATAGEVPGETDRSHPSGEPAWVAAIRELSGEVRALRPGRD
jgi:hypothetical protein